MPEGLNQYEALQVKEIGDSLGERIIEKAAKYFVTRSEHKDIVYKQNLKINTVIGVIGFSGFIALIFQLIQATS